MLFLFLSLSHCFSVSLCLCLCLSLSLSLSLSLCLSLSQVVNSITNPPSYRPSHVTSLSDRQPSGTPVESYRSGAKSPREPRKQKHWNDRSIRFIEHSTCLAEVVAEVYLPTTEVPTRILTRPDQFCQRERERRERERERERELSLIHI